MLQKTIECRVQGGYAVSTEKKAELTDMVAVWAHIDGVHRSCGGWRGFDEVRDSGLRRGG